LRLALLALFLTSCGVDPAQRDETVLAEAYVGPRILNLRAEIDLRSPNTGTARHGERVEIVQRRRRFFRVRTDSGAVGWTDHRMLLNKEEITIVLRMEELAAKLPSQGMATVFDVLNAHLEPYRQSPTIFQLNEGERVDVLAYQVMPRVAPERKPLIPPPPPPKPISKKPRKEPKIPPPPSPAAPPLPANWLDLSKTPPPPEEEAADDSQQTKAPPPPGLDDWALVRLKSDEAGWVLTSRLYMMIPDEVAQYAEGRRITSYFSLGEVQDGDQKKHHWLWTTIGQRNEPYDFEMFRVFIWNTRRHRYETAYSERNRVGYLPVIVRGQQFSLCMEGKDGERYRRTYELQVNIVRFIGEEPCGSRPSELLVAKLQDGLEPPDGPKAPQQITWIDRVKRWFRH
jgi:hypothetical protein